MKRIFRYVFWLIILNLLIPGAAFIFNELTGLSLELPDTILLSTLFSVVSLITLAVFFRGYKREPDAHAMYTLVAISLKFLLDMIVALLWFFIFKKTSLPSVVLFFVIYLTFTLFSIIIILKMLKIRSL